MVSASLNAPEATGFVSGPTAWQWLTPATAIFIAAMVFLNTNSRNWTDLIVSPAASLEATLALNSPDLASYSAASGHSDHNVWPVATFDWTNGGHSLTTPTPVFRTNSLMR